MTDLRPSALALDAPLILTVPARPLLDASVRPLCRGLALAAALSLPALGPLAADRLAIHRHPEVARAAVAPLLPPAGGAAARLALRVALLEGTVR